MHWCASRCWSPTVIGADPVFDAGNDPPVRRGTTRRRGAATEVRTAHARYFAGREADIMALWDSPRQREAYDWFSVELANLRTAFRWAAEHDDLDTAAAIAIYATMLGLFVEQYEPVAWAEELIEPAREGRPSATRAALRGGRAVPRGRTGRRRCRLPRCQPPDNAARRIRRGSIRATKFDRHCVQPCRSVRPVGRPVPPCDRGRGGPSYDHPRKSGYGVVFLGEGDDARAASEGLLAAADATHNPMTACFALLAHGLAYHDADPVAAYDALRRALTVAAGERQPADGIGAVAVTCCGSVRLPKVTHDPEFFRIL